MTAEQIVGLSIYASGALIFSVAAVLALGAAMDAEGRLRRLMVPALYALILLYNCIAPIVDGRDLYALGQFASPGGAGEWLLRFVLLGLLAICVARFSSAAFCRDQRGAGGWRATPTAWHLWPWCICCSRSTSPSSAAGCSGWDCSSAWPCWRWHSPRRPGLRRQLRSPCYICCALEPGGWRGFPFSGWAF